jgi:hypothetical protein
MVKRNDPDPDPGHDPDRDHDPLDAVAPAPTGNSLTALTALGTVLNGVDTSSVVGRSGLPMLLFKAREANGTWMFGQKKTIPEAGSLWAAHPGTFQRGYICWGPGNKKLGERMLPVSLPMVNVAELPDLGAQWQEQWSIQMRCTNGTDAGTEVVHKMSTVGGIQAIVGLLAEVRDRLNGGQHDGKIMPIALLEKYSYPHPEFGKTWNPQLTITDWALLDSPTSSPPPPPTATEASAAEQPRRRRVA